MIALNISEVPPNSCRVSKSIDPSDPLKLTGETRQLGLVVCRGTAVVVVYPSDGSEEIANPFVGEE